MKKRFIFCLIILFSLFVLANFALAKKCATDEDCQKASEEERTIKCINGECVKAFEIVYPKIAGEELTIEKVASEGLPAYIKYIFTVAVGIIGFVIFSALVYNGIRYLTSAGNPNQMADAKNGVISAFAGGFLLLFSVLIFKTINPTLTILESPKPTLLEQVITPGVYICNYSTTTIEDVLKRYISEKGEKQIAAAKELRAILWDPKTKRGCPKFNFSTNFQNFSVISTNTIFIIPSIFEDPKTHTRQAEYEYGIILHERENFGGRCYRVKTDAGAQKIYGGQVQNYSASQPPALPFTAHSVTIFKKPSEKGEGVTLYECLSYNTKGKCTDNDPPQEMSFKPDGTPDWVRSSKDELDKFKLTDNIRSIGFSPVGGYFALLYEEDQFNGKCTRVYSNNPNLLDVLPTGGRCVGWGLINPINWFKECKPLFKSMEVIKGTVL